jgi:uncharacterized protein (PEP-CTERM system associated)
VAAIRTRARLLGGLLVTFLIQSGAAIAFPFIDPTNQDNAPTGLPTPTELPAADVQALRKQFRLINPGAAGNPSGWTIAPRLTLQEMFTDNAFEVRSPRVFDAITVVAPGIAILADTSRLQLNFDYSPNLVMHAVNGNLNALTQQLTATGLLTVVPDLAYVDVRALSGVQSRFGALTGAGTLGAGGVAANGQAGAGYAGTGQGLNRNNSVQTTSFGISPYLLKQFGDFGTGKVGVSFNAAHYSSISGFAPPPFPTGGSNGSTLLTTEELAHFTSGQFLDRFQYTFDADVSQSRTTNYAGATTVGTTNVTTSGGAFSSQRETINNTLSFALNRTFTFNVSAGQQHIEYGNNAGPAINGLIWNLGVTITPGPYSSMTVSYGHLNGADSFTADGHIEVGGRSLLSFSYNNSVGTQLENLQNQFNNGVIGPNGQVINFQTGGPSFTATNALGVQNGVFRFKTATAAWTTQWDRDTFQATLTWQEQTNLTPGQGFSPIQFDPITGQPFISIVPITTGTSTDIRTGAVYWTHEVSPDLFFNSSASYSYIRRNGGANDSSFSTAFGLQYTLSQATTLTARYSFFDRVSKIPGYSLYENVLLLGVTKQF